MFQAARLTTPSKGKQSECPPAVGWMRRSCGVRVTDPVRVNRRPPRAGPGQIPFVAQPKKPGALRPGGALSRRRLREVLLCGEKPAAVAFGDGTA